MSMDSSFDRIETLKDEEPLKLLRKIFVDWYLSKTSKIIIYVLLAMQVPMWFLQIYYSFAAFNVVFLAQYGPTFCCSTFSFVSMLIQPFYENALKSMIQTQRTKYWSLNMASTGLRCRILRLSKGVDFISALNLLLVYIACTTYFYKIENEWEILFYSTFFKEHAPDYATVLIGVYNIAFFIAAYYMIASLYLCFYFTFHGVFQLAILNEYILKIPGSYNVNKDLELPYDKQYQQEIFRRLKFCLKHHNLTIRHATRMINLFRTAIMFTFVTGAGLGFNIVGNYYLNPIINYPRIGAFFIAGSLSVVMIAENGQLVIDWSPSSFTKFVKLPWYTWNVKNQKILISSLIYSRKSLQVSPNKHMLLERRFLIQVIKYFWTLLTFVSSTSNRKN